MANSLYVLTYDSNRICQEDIQIVSDKMKDIVGPEVEFVIMPNQFQLATLDEESIIQLKDYLEDLLYRRYVSETSTT